MAYAFVDEVIGLPVIGQTDSAVRSPALPGMFAHAVDPTLGGGEFVYLQGFAGCALGTLVTYNQGSASAAAAVAAHGSPVAVAMQATGANTWGWFMVSGKGKIAKDGSTPTAGHAVQVSATPGVISDIAVATPLASGTLSGAVVAAAGAGADTTLLAQLTRPTIS